MKNQQPIIREDDEHRVLKFVPRTTATPPDDAGGARDLSSYERAPDEPDDFRHRMMANAAAFALTAALTGLGIWLAVSIADLRRTQDCVLTGRRDCAHISVPRS